MVNSPRGGVNRVPACKSPFKFITVLIGRDKCIAAGRRLINFPVNVVTFADRKEAHCTEIPTNYTAVNYQLDRLRGLYLKKNFFPPFSSSSLITARDASNARRKIDLTAARRMATVEKKVANEISWVYRSAREWVSECERERERERERGKEARKRAEAARANYPARNYE